MSRNTLGAASSRRFGAWLSTLRKCSIFAAAATLYCIHTPTFADDNVLLDAADAFRSRSVERLGLLAQNLRGQLLEDYPQYWYLQATLKDTDTASVQNFLSRYPNTPLAERLRSDWLKQLGAQHEWREFSAQIGAVTQPDAELACYALNARMAAGEKHAEKDARATWLNAKGSLDGCNDLLDPLRAANAVSQEDLWQRIRLLLDGNFVSAARVVSDALPTAQALPEKHLSSATNQPQRFLDKQPLSLKTRAGRELTVYALAKIARNDPAAAVDTWSEKLTAFTAAERNYVWSMLAYRGAMDHHPSALAWFRQAGDAPSNDVVTAWRARAALRAQDWSEVLVAIGAMSTSQASEPAWRYWKARALQADGEQAQANAIYFDLSKQTHFYGLLAAEELGPVISAPREPWKPAAEHITAIEAMPGIQRALALYRLNLMEEAKAEWNYAMRGLDDRQLLAAAALAHRANWYDRMISAAERTQTTHDFALRYPLPYREALERGARAQGLDEAWVFGLVRQESRFISDARSSAGAMGLMQLMPATARWVAQRMGIARFSVADAREVETNASLGAYYLKHTLDELGHPVLATAAYNAGPGRARRWMSATPMEGAIYAETIPFTETRDYVKKVMSNASYYAAQLGHKSLSLKQRLGVFPERSSNAALYYK